MGNLVTVVRRSLVFLILMLASLPLAAQRPVADFGWSPENPPINSLISIQDRSSGATSTTFYIENSHPQPGSTAALAFNAPGTFELKMVATNAAGSSTKIRWINAGVASEARMQVSAATVAIGQAVTFSDQSSGLVQSRSWAFGDGSSSGEEQAQHAYTTAGTYTVTLRANYGSGSKTTTRTIVVQGAPEALQADFDWSPDIPFIGQSVVFRDRSKGNPTSWRWNFGDGSDDETSTASSPVHKYANAGKYLVALSVKNGTKTEIATHEIYVASAGSGGQAVLEPEFTVAPSCPIAKEPVQFIDRSEGFPIRWSWSFGNGAMSSDRSPITTFNLPGKYVVTLELFDGYETRRTSQNVTIHPNFQLVPRADFTSPCCAATGIARPLQNTTTGDATSFLWDFGDGTTSTERNALHAWSRPGTYMIRLTALNENGEHRFGRSIRVDDPDTPPVADFIWEPSAHIAPGQSVTFTNRSGFDAVAFHWRVTGPGIEPREAVTRGLEMTFPRSGLYQVTLDAIDAYGSVGSVTREVAVVEGRLIASFVCRATGSFETVDSNCGSCPCESYDQEARRCLRYRQADCGNSCVYTFPAYYDRYTCSDKSSGSPDVSTWLIPQTYESQRTGDDVHFTIRTSGNGEPYTFWVHHTAHRLLDGESSTAIQEVRSGGGSGIAVNADFTWSPAVPRAGDEVTFEHRATGTSVFEWIVDGEHHFTGPSFTYRFTESGRHQVQLMAGARLTGATRLKFVEIAAKATPEFKSVNSRWGQCFFSTVDLQTDIEATMNWGGTPARAAYRINGGPERAITNFSGDTFSFPINSRELKFSQTSGNFLENKITVSAKNAGGDEASFNFTLGTFNTSGGWLKNVEKVQREEGRYSVTNVLNMPQPEWEGQVQFPSAIPFIGGKIIGLKKTQGTIESSYKTDCTASTLIKGQTGFQVGPGIITGALFGKGETQFTPSGITEKGTLGFEIAGAIEPEPVPIVTAIPSAAAVCAVPGLDALCGILKVKSEFKVAAGAEFDFNTTRGTPVFVDGRAIITPSMKVGLVGEVAKGLSFEVWGGGQTAFTMHPVPPILRKVEAAVESGFLVNVFVFQVEEKLAIVCEYTPETGFKCLGPSPVAATAPGQSLRLTEMPVHGATEVAARRLRARGESVVLESLSRLAAPEAAASGNEIMAVYLAENPAVANTLQRTDVRYTTRQNGAWSHSEPLTSDQLGDFGPTLTAASGGRFVALWQRVKNGALRAEDVATVADLPKLNREMEIVTSTWSPGSRSWSAPIVLTDNDVYDHEARAVALADGRVLAVWLRDRANDLVGTSASPTEVVARTLTGAAWGAETIVASGLVGVQGLSLAARDNEALLAFSRDKDASPTVGTDREIAIASFTGGAWGTLRDQTTDAVADLTPTVVYGNDGPRILWIRGADLVWQPVGGTPEIVRASEGSAALLDFTATVTPKGEFAVVWSESVDGTADVIVRTYDPITRLWSEDIPLTRNDAVESSLSAFHADGKLQVTGLETNTVYANETRLVNGSEVVIPAVAHPGSISLIHLDKELVVDLSIDQNTLAVDADAPSAGQNVTLTAVVCNDGDLPLRDVTIAVYAGRGTGGALLATAKVAGDWRGGESRTVSIAFPYSEAAQEVTLVIDPLGVSGDRSFANNQASFSYRNAAPVACLQMNRMIGNAPLTVTVDARCSSDRDGRVVASRWSFGDGSAGTGDVTTHTFANKGAHNVTLTVTDDLGRSSSTTATVYVDALAELRNGTAPSRYLPIAGRTAGAAGTFFVSDATVYNPNAATELVVDAMYLPDGRLDYHYARLVIPPDQMLDLSDLIAKTFRASGVGWVRFDLSDPSAVITSRTYNKQPIGTAGTFVPAASSADAIRPLAKRIFLQEWRSGYRTNLGLTEISGNGADVVVSSFNAAGGLVGRKSYQLAPWSHMQVNGDALFQQAGRIEMEASSGAVIGYLSTVDNGTGDAVYQEGVERTSITAGARWIVPTVGRLAGANNTRWRSDVRLWNAESTPSTVHLELRRGATTVQKDIVLQGGQTAAYDDVVSALFPELGDLSGVLAISSDGALFATSRIYNESTSGTYGMAAPPRMEADLLTAGDLRDLLQIANDSDYRCNLGMTALDEGAEVRVRAFDPKGKLLGSKTYAVAPRANAQVNGIFNDLGITAAQSAARLQVHVLSGRVYAYASVIDNKTGDAIFVEGRR